MIVLQVPAPTGQFVLFDIGERVQAVQVGNPMAYAVDITPTADGIFIRPLQAAAGIRLSVRSDRREYAFVINGADSVSAPYLVSVAVAGVNDRTPETDDGNADRSMHEEHRAKFTYRISGGREVRPSSIRDDGGRTFLRWSPDQPLPAVFAIDAHGNEEVVNGNMRGQEFILDRVYDQLVFRIDKTEAHARRLIGRKP